MEIFRQMSRGKRTNTMTRVFPSSGFTLLAFDLPGSAPQDLQPNPVQSIMQCFGWDDMLHPILVTRYLPHLLQNRCLSLARRSRHSVLSCVFVESARLASVSSFIVQHTTVDWELNN